VEYGSIVAINKIVSLFKAGAMDAVVPFADI